VLALLEGYQHFGEERYALAAARGARTLAAAVAQEWPLSSLYFGLPAWRSRCTRPATGWEIARPLRPRPARWTSSARELLRYARVREGRDSGYAITWPDHPPAVPAATSRHGAAKPAGRG
jgi:hypothetical protein